jgi:hypothetical protein
MIVLVFFFVILIVLVVNSWKIPKEIKLLEEEANSRRNYTKRSKNEEKTKLHRVTVVLDRATI